MWHKQIHHHLKNFLGKAYHTGKNILGHMDEGYRTARKLYSIAQPALEHFAPETKKVLDMNVSRVGNDYENIRHKVVNAHSHMMKT